MNQYIINPALTGIENYSDLKLSFRDQWVGLDGAPRTMYASVHKPIGKQDFRTSATSYDIPGQNPRGTAYWENYEAASPHHGIGFILLNDQTGLFNRITAQASYAYHIGLSPKTNLSAGFAAGIMKLGRNAGKSVFNNGDPTDPAEGNGSDIYRIRPDLSAGFYLYSASYFTGISVQQLIPHKIAYSSLSKGSSQVIHVFATAGYRFLVSEDLNMVPSVMLKYVPGTPASPQYDINVKMQYRDLLWLGGSIRYQDGYAIMAGINTGNTFNISYAYDFTKTELNTASRGTHEFILGFLIGNKYGDSCPRNVW